jgi:hypothetical protein
MRGGGAGGAGPWLLACACMCELWVNVCGGDALWAVRRV